MKNVPGNGIQQKLRLLLLWLALASLVCRPRYLT
jgi:hypothetical protein